MGTSNKQQQQWLTDFLTDHVLGRDPMVFDPNTPELTCTCFPHDTLNSFPGETGWQDDALHLATDHPDSDCTTLAEAVTHLWAVGQLDRTDHFLAQPARFSEHTRSALDIVFTAAVELSHAETPAAAETIIARLAGVSD